MLFVIFPFERTGIGHKYFPCAEISPCPRCLGPSNVPTLAIAFPLPCLHMISRIFFFILALSSQCFLAPLLSEIFPFEKLPQPVPTTRCRLGVSALEIQFFQREREREWGEKKRQDNKMAGDDDETSPFHAPTPTKGSTGWGGGMEGKGEEMPHALTSQPANGVRGWSPKKEATASFSTTTTPSHSDSFGSRKVLLLLPVSSFFLCSSFLFLCCGDGGRHVTVSAFFPTFPPPTDPLGKKGGLKIGLGVCCF